jgi:hypothetical protein
LSQQKLLRGKGKQLVVKEVTSHQHRLRLPRDGQVNTPGKGGSHRLTQARTPVLIFTVKRGVQVNVRQVQKPKCTHGLILLCITNRNAVFSVPNQSIESTGLPYRTIWDVFFVVSTGFGLDPLLD